VSCITTGDDNAGADHDNPAVADPVVVCDVELLPVAAGSDVELGGCVDGVD